MESIIAVFEIRKRVRGLLPSLDKVKLCSDAVQDQPYISVKKKTNFKVVLEW